MTLAKVKSCVVRCIPFMIFLSSCGNNPEEMAKRSEKEKGILMDTDITFAKTSVAQGAAEAFRFFLDENAIQLPNNGFPIIGRDSIVSDMRSLKGYTLDWQPEQASVSLSGDIGYTWGHYVLTRVQGAESTQVSRGKYLNVWKRQSDGTWKVVVDMGNVDPKTGQ